MAGKISSDWAKRIPRYERTVLVLQGGGALGAYQAGVYEALAKHGILPDWVTGISIGAINSALIAGNPPERRVERLREFWDLVSSGDTLPAPEPEMLRTAFNFFSAQLAVFTGIPGFFEPRIPPPLLQAPGTQGARSFYDVSRLRGTLEQYVDFDLINAGKVRLALGAVDVELGNSIYFDNTRQRIAPEHVMASGALPPGFPPVEIDGRYYWDGGVVSNSPLTYVVDDRPRVDSLVFQVDLFRARGPIPNNLPEVFQRYKDIMYSSRTRFNSDQMVRLHELQHALQTLLEKLPPSLRDGSEVTMLREAATPATLHIAHAIYRRKGYELHSKDCEFSRASVREHWKAGHDDIMRALARDVVKGTVDSESGLIVTDLTAPS